MAEHGHGDTGQRVARPPGHAAADDRDAAPVDRAGRDAGLHAVGAGVEEGGAVGERRGHGGVEGWRHGVGRRPLRGRQVRKRLRHRDGDLPTRRAAVVALRALADAAGGVRAGREAVDARGERRGHRQRDGPARSLARTQRPDAPRAERCPDPSPQDEPDPRSPRPPAAAVGHRRGDLEAGPRLERRRCTRHGADDQVRARLGRGRGSGSQQRDQQRAAKKGAGHGAQRPAARLKNPEVRAGCSG